MVQIRINWRFWRIYKVLLRRRLPAAGRAATSRCTRPALVTAHVAPPPGPAHHLAQRTAWPPRALPADLRAGLGPMAPLPGVRVGNCGVCPGGGCRLLRPTAPLEQRLKRLQISGNSWRRAGRGLDGGDWEGRSVLPDQNAGELPFPTCRMTASDLPGKLLGCKSRHLQLGLVVWGTQTLDLVGQSLG